jgi:hypothetical protein
MNVFFDDQPHPVTLLLSQKPKLEAELAAIIATELNFTDSLEAHFAFSPYAAAERLSGKPAKEDAATLELAMLLNMAHARQMEKILDLRSDTIWQNPYGDYLETLIAEGFSKVLALPFTSLRGLPETFEIWWHHQGLLLCFDTTSALQINRAAVYYNWAPAPNVLADGTVHKYISSGFLTGPEDAPVWVGYHDARQALRHHLHQLRTHGSFRSPWLEMPALDLLHAEDADADFPKINQARLALLPEWVRSAIPAANLQRAL